jgi:hypothetical protein
MRPTTILVPLLFTSWLTGCDGDDPGTGGDPVTITITADKAPALVAVRDGLDGTWQPATMKSPTTFEAVVHGPYMITVVCEDIAAGDFTTLQVARTPDDEGDDTFQCDFSFPAAHEITGRMVQAGRIQIGEGIDTSATGNWDFNAGTRAGTYDLMARDNNRIVLRRGVTVAGPVALTPPIDIVQEGTVLANTAFTVTNAMANETVVASVHLDKAAPSTPFGIYLGPIGTAKAVPESLLTSTDKQSASLQGTVGNELRALRRPFRVGGDTAFTLPAPLGGVQWEQAANLSVSWTTMPELTSFGVSAFAATANPVRVQSHRLNMTPSFMAATGITRATIDTDIAGYKPEWRINFTREYTRDLFVQRVANSEIASNILSETMNVGQAGPRATALRARAYGRLAAQP